MFHTLIVWFLFNHGKMFFEDRQHLTGRLRVWSSDQILFCTGLYIYILLFCRVLCIHLEFPWPYCMGKMQIKPFSSNANSRYYCAPTIFDGAAFNQPLCTDLQLRYFRLTCFNIFLTILGKVFCVTYRLLG